MNVIIFGATGSLGRHLVEQALSQGHQVTAFARHPEKLNIGHERLKAVAGDVLDSKYAAVINQANNRTYAAQAVLKKLLESL